MTNHDQHPRAVIFDMDGVLIDSYHAHFESWKLVGHEEGLTITEEAFAKTFGRTSREVVADLWNDPGMPPDRIAEIDHAKEAMFRELLREHVPEMPGAVDLLTDLRDSGWKLAIGSSGPPENVQLIVNHFTIQCGSAGHPLFEAVITGSDVTRGKPDPQVFLLAAERLNTPASRCIVVEDAVPGVKAAAAADMRCIIVVSTGHTYDEYEGLPVVRREPSLHPYSSENLAALLAEE